MKIFTSLFAMLFISAFSFGQSNPCPDVQSHGYNFVSINGPNCMAKVFVYATGDVAAQKGMKIAVYQGPGGTGTLLTEVCHIVPPNSPSTLYETAVFSAPCNAPLSYVITRYTASNGSCQGGTCGTTITIDGGPLPIKISSFYVKRDKNTVTLNWRSETEINAKEFIIERNTGNGFIAVGSVAASNNPNGNSYVFQDNNTSKTVSQYRLKLVDVDASFKLSDIRTVKGTAAVSDFTVYPNPSIGFVKIDITDISEATHVEVIDNAGRVIKTVELKNSSSVQINNLQNGIYLVRLTNKATGEAVTKKISVTN